MGIATGLGLGTLHSRILIEIHILKGKSFDLEDLLIHYATVVTVEDSQTIGVMFVGFSLPYVPPLQRTLGFVTHHRPLLLDCSPPRLRGIVLRFSWSRYSTFVFFTRGCELIGSMGSCAGYCPALLIVDLFEAKSRSLLIVPICLTIDVLGIMPKHKVTGRFR